MAAVKYTRVINNVIEMLEERGDDASELRADPSIFEKYAQDVLSVRLVLYTKYTAIIFHVYNTTLNNFFTGKDSPMKTPDDIAGLTAQFKDRKQFVFICSDKVTPVTLKNAKDKVKALDKLLFTAAAGTGVPAGFQLFEEKYLMYNPAKHELVPRHMRLSKEEAKRVKEIYNIKTVNGVSQLPIISNTDIMARWLGLRHGDVVMITRNNPNSGTYYYYRICT